MGRRQFTPEFKTKIVVELLREEKPLKTEGIRQSMDGKARWVDNVVIERWFRSLKTERIYVNEYTTPKALRAGIQEYIYEYNTARPHQTYNYMTPMQVYLAQRIAA